MYYSQLEKNATRIGCREERDELDHTVGHAVPFADTVVATREEDADATHTELREQVARLHYVSPRAPILVDAVRRTDRLRDPRLVEDEVKPGEVQVFCAQRPSAGAVEDVRRRIRHGLSVLGVDVRLGVGVARIVPPPLTGTTVKVVPAVSER